MAKNMTRKGLAFGAAATLVVSGFVGAAPAQADGLYVANYVSLVPNAGTSYATLSSEAFDLKSNVVGTLAGNANKDLKFLVTDPDELLRVDIDVDAQATASEAPAAAAVTAASAKSGTSTTLSVAAHGLAVGDAIHVTTAATAGLAIGYYKVTAVPTAESFTIDTGTTTAMDITSVPVYVTADLSDLDSRELIAAVGTVDNTNGFATASVPTTIGGVALTDGRKADGSFVVNSETNVNTNDRVLRLVNTDATESTVVTVTAWVDDNDNNIIDATEYVSETRTVNFYKTSDLTVTTALVTPVIGDETISGTITISPELNGSQIRTTSAYGVYVTPTVQDGTATVTSVTWSSTNKNWAIVLRDSNSVEVGTFTAKAEIADAAAGNTASVLVSTRTSTDTELESVATVDQQGALDDNAGDAETNVKVRPGKTATLVATAYDTNGDEVGAGKTVNVALSSATTTTDWYVNDIKVLDNAASVTKQYVTDANGQVSLAIKSTSGLSGDTIIVDVQPEGLTGAAAASLQLTYETATFALVDLNAPANGAARNLAKTGSMSLDIYAGDQWNAPLTGDYRLQMSLSGQSDGTDLVSFATGRATYTFSDEALTAGGTITVSTQLQKLTSGVWANSTAATDLADITVTVSTDPVTSIVLAATYTADTGGDASADTTFDLWEKQIVAHNVETSQTALVLPYAVASDDTVSIALGAGTGLAVGDTVTVSGAGLWFGYLDGGVAGTGTLKRLSPDSLTFVLDNAADVIGVYSNTYVKDAVVSVTSRGRTGTVKVSSHVAGPDSGASVVWDVPVSAGAGSTFTVKGTLVDKFGNAVDATSGDVSVTYSGPGFVSGTLPVDTNSLGQFTFGVLLGSNDVGTGTITFAYDIAADGDLLDLGDFATSKTVIIGTAGNTGDFSSWTKKLDDSSAKIYAKNVVGEGKVQFFLNGKEIAWVNASSSADSKLRTANGASYLVRTVEFAAGKNVLEVYVDGVRTTRTAYTK